MAVSGIYKIVNVATKKLYIGSAEDINNRWSVHRTSLKRNDHYNKYLQRAWNKYGESVFKFDIVEITPNKNKLLRLRCEQYWMDIFKSYNRRFGYNLLPKAGSPLGSKWTKPHPNKGIRVGPQSTETCYKKSLSHIGIKMPKFTKKHRKNISKSCLGRIPWNKGLIAVQTSWNKGLTKKTNSSLLRTARKLSKLKRGISVGPFSKKHIKNLSGALIGNTRNLGKKQSKATQRKKRDTYYKNHPQYKSRTK